MKFDIVQCADCHGSGGYRNIVCVEGGPWEECALCQGMGMTTRFMNGMIFVWRKNPKAEHQGEDYVGHDFAMNAYRRTLP